MITIYRFYEAPQRFRQLSEHGGDEDFIVVGQPKDADLRGIAEKLTVCDNHYVDVIDNGMSLRVYITAHA